MAANIDAVIAALYVALEEAEDSDHYDWSANKANRWINQLPGAGFGRWRHLKLTGDSVGEVSRRDFIGHVKATLAYLETNRDAIKSMRFWWSPFWAGKIWANSDPIDAEFTDITPGRTKAPATKSRKSMRVVK